jgi:hypothetical protein
MKLCLMNLSADDGTTAQAGPPPAVPAAEVLEFRTEGALTPVPLAPALLAGIANFHGQIVPVITTSQLLDPGPDPQHDQDRNLAETPYLVVSGPDGPLGLQLDSVDLVTLAEPDPADSQSTEEQAESKKSDDPEEKSSPDDEKSAQLSAQTAQEALFSEEAQLLSYKVLEESHGSPMREIDKEDHETSAAENGGAASGLNEANQTAPGIEGIFSRTLEIEERGVYRQIDTSALSSYLKHLLGTVTQQT